MAKISQRQVVAELQPVNLTGHTPGPAIPNYFAQMTGGEITAAVEKVYDGGEQFPETLCAPSEIGDVTLTRHYDVTRDGVPLKSLRSLVGRTYYDIYVYELDCDLKIPGTQRVYPRALLVGLSEPEGDSSSGAPATFSLTFSIGQVTGTTA